MGRSWSRSNGSRSGGPAAWERGSPDKTPRAGGVARQRFRNEGKETTIGVMPGPRGGPRGQRAAGPRGGPRGQGPRGQTYFLLLWLSALSWSSWERYRGLGASRGQFLYRECRDRRQQDSGLRWRVRDAEQVPFHRSPSVRVPLCARRGGMSRRSRELRAASHEPGEEKLQAQAHQSRPRSRIAPTGTWRSRAQAPHLPPPAPWTKWTTWTLWTAIPGFRVHVVHPVHFVHSSAA